MNPFKITCVTCRARLAVRNEALIGQILACPKCGSMVQVAAPAAGATTDSVSGSSIVLTGVLEPQVVEVPVAAPAAADAPATFDDVSILHTATPGAGAPPPAAPPLAPATSLASGWTGKQLAALVVGGAVAGSALVAAVLWSLRTTPAAPTTTPAVAAAQDPAVDQGDASVAPPVDVEVPDEQAAAADVESPASAPDDNPAPEPAGDPITDAPAATADAAADPSPPPLPTPPDAAPPVATVTDPTPPIDNAPRLRIDPLDLDPEGLDLTTLSRGTGADPLAASELADVPTPPPGGSMAPAGPADDAPPAEPEPIRFEPVGPPANVESLLSRKLPAVTVDKMPLCRFLDFATALSGLPVSVAPVELRLAAVSAASPVSAEVEDATIEELLAAALKPLRLAPSVAGAQIVLRRIGADQRRELAYPIDDLARGAAETEQLGAWVQEFVAPESWQPQGGEGTLTVEGAALRIDQAERVGYEALLLLEELRLARGLTPRSKYPVELLPQPGAHAVLAARLADRVTFTISPGEPLRAVVRWWQEQSQTAILVDWSALADQRTWPQSRITTSATDAAWSEALDAALEPLGLGWRTVDARTIEITSLEKVRREPVVLVYALSPGAAARSDDVLATIERLAGEVGAGANSGAGAVDDEHGVLLVRQPAAVQRRLAAWLADEGLAAAD